jgi:hypothetical protein
LEKIKPLRAGTTIFIPPKGKLVLDRDDITKIKKRKRAYKTKHKKV